jgi:hypothetical protein
MQLLRYCLLVLAALAVAGSDAVPAPSPRAAPCGAPAAQPPGAKPSSYVPRPRSGKRVYGAPIQQPIFKSRPKPRRHPAASAAP